MDQNWFYLIEQASDISKIIFSFIIYACCLNKTRKTIIKLTNEQPSSHFFLTNPLFPLEKRCHFFKNTNKGSSVGHKDLVIKKTPTNAYKFFFNTFLRIRSYKAKDGGHVFTAKKTQTLTV